MIRVRFLGGAKKSFSADNLCLDADCLSLDELIRLLQKKKPVGTPDLDMDNTLIAVNGADSSVMGGRDAVVRSGDIVSIIPVIHGGSGPALSFVVHRTNIMAFPIRGKGSYDHTFLDSMRASHPRLAIQAMSSRFILGPSHLKKILAISLESKRRRIMLSHRIEVDILLRFAATSQISKAVDDLGIKPRRDFVVIALGKKPDLARLKRDLLPVSDPRLLCRPHGAHLRRYFRITKRQLDSVQSREPLEDLLAERASVLF